MWKKSDEHELANEILNLLPNRSFTLPTGRGVIFSITGGEPTLRAKFLPELFNAVELEGCKHILIETNCAVPLKREFIMEINSWLAADKCRKWTWSNSPKLSVSGEAWEDAIRPDIAAMQVFSGTKGMEQYFKFVCGPNDKDFDEVAAAMEEYFAVGISRDTEVYVMPTACTEEQQQQVSSGVAKMCMSRGYIYCHRIQNSAFGNGTGT
jgi:organic radical activating enzyme